MISRFTFFVVVMIVGTLIEVSCHAGIVVSNAITNSNPSVFNPYNNDQVTSPNISASGIGRGTGIFGVNTANRYNADSWNTPSIDLNAYFTFTIAPNANYSIDFENFVYSSQRSGNGPLNFAFRSSLDNFVSNIGVPTFSGATISLLAPQFQNVTTSIEFRLYGWGATSANGAFSVNDFSFSGIVSAIPEPTALLMTGGVICVVGLSGCRSKRRKI